MVSGNWRREEKGWVQARSIMDSGCGASVAPPGVCPTYPLKNLCQLAKTQCQIWANKSWKVFSIQAGPLH